MEWAMKNNVTIYHIHNMQSFAQNMPDIHSAYCDLDKLFMSGSVCQFWLQQYNIFYELSPFVGEVEAIKIEQFSVRMFNNHTHHKLILALH